MESATGAMSMLLPKLGMLLKGEYDLQRSVKERIDFLISELEHIQAFLEKVSYVPIEQLDMNVKIWARNVRELSYRMEDTIDTFMLHVDRLEPTNKSKFEAFITRWSVSTVRIRHRIAKEIKVIESQVNKVREQYNRYKIDSIEAQRPTTIDPRIFTLHEKATNLVGIEKARDDLIIRSKVNDSSEKELRMISIVGFGGLGKTTLAKAVFDMHKENFDRACFIPVGQKPNNKKVLRDILIACKLIGDKEAVELDENQLINKLHGCLEKERYLIVIDDVWEKEAWDLIKLALVDGECGSRVIITTRISKVAEAVGNIYMMEPLSVDNSRKLFYTRVTKDQYKGPPVDYSDDATKKILKKCGGVPLAIITIASLLVGIPVEEWSKVYDSIGFGPEDQSEAVQNTRKIISFSYYDLPLHLRTCLLHLSIFPEDEEIKKDSLIWMWIAEGFIREEHGKWSFEVGEGYFAELINRSMIQPVDRWDGTVYACRIHDLVLDLIRTMVAEVNFVEILDGVHQQNISAGQRTITVRRLAWQKWECGLMNDDMAKHLRSFTVIQCCINRIPLLGSFQALRVLLLKYCSLIQDFELKHIGKLCQLRYLCLVHVGARKLPREIGDLVNLLALEIQEFSLKKLPETISKLGKLRRLRLRASSSSNLSLRNLTSLEDLSLDNVGMSPELALELGKLTELRLLHVSFYLVGKCSMESVLESLRGLRKVQDVRLELPGDWSKSVCCEGWEPSRQFSKLYTEGFRVLRLPQWVNSTCVPHLSTLILHVLAIEARDMEILAEMRALRCLELHYVGRFQWIVPGGGFSSLRTCRMLLTLLTFLPGAMPMLEELRFGMLVPSCGGATDTGLWNLPQLRKVTVRLFSDGDTTLGLEKQQKYMAALRRAADAHPNHPSLSLW